MTMWYSLSVYSLLIFTPPHYFRQPWRLTLTAVLIFTVQIVYVIMIAFYERGKRRLANQRLDRSEYNPYRSTQQSQSGTATVRQAILSLDRYDWLRISVSLGLLLFTALIDIFVFAGMSLEVKIALYDHHGFLFFLFCIAVGVLFYRGIDRFQNPPVRGAVSYRITMLASIVILFYLTIASYAYLIFPFIPIAKGGADFTAAPYSSVQKHASDKPDTGMILLYATSSVSFFAKPMTGNDACRWRLGDPLPAIIRIPDSNISFTETTPLAQTRDSNCFDQSPTITVSPSSPPAIH
jgi:hypothetical protein